MFICYFIKLIPISFLTYCAISIEILVPRGQLNDIFSESHTFFWYVRNVPDSSAENIDKKHKLLFKYEYYLKIISGGVWGETNKIIRFNV